VGYFKTEGNMFENNFDLLPKSLKCTHLLFARLAVENNFDLLPKSL
jgi:hypothetical protein